MGNFVDNLCINSSQLGIWFRYPREKGQGIAFENTIAPVDLIIFLDCSTETMVRRVLGRARGAAVARADDNEATIRNRIEIFSKSSEEILAQYPTKVKKVFQKFSIT